MNTLSTTASIDYPSQSQTVLLLFCGYVVIWYLQIGYRIPFLGEIRFEFIYATILIIIMFFTGGFHSFENPLLKYLVLFFLCLLIEIPFSHDVNLSWNIFIDRIIKFCFMAVFIAAFVKSPRHLVFFLGAFLLACLKMGQEGFIGQITGALVWENQGVMRLHGSTPIYAHPNSFAGMALGTLPFIYYLMPISPLWIKIVLLTQLAFAANIIIFTGSRTGYVAFILFVFFVFLRSKSKKKFLIYAGIIAIVALPIFPKDYEDRFQTIFTGQDREGHSIETRKEIQRDAWQIFLEHPLGVGISAFPAVRKARFGRTQDTHNLYLEVATNLGIQGFIVFILFIFNIMRLLNKLSNNALLQKVQLEKALAQGPTFKAQDIEIDRHVANLKLIQAASSAVFMFLIIRLALGFFGMDLYEIYWWFSIGLTISLYNMNTVAQEKTEHFLFIMRPDHKGKGGISE